MKNEILGAGLKVYPEVTLTKIAEVLGVSTPSIFYHFTAKELKEAVEEYALKVDDRQVIAQMITAKNEQVAHMTDKEKLKYLVDSV